MQTGRGVRSDGVVVFFYKQKTADDMRISDWSSDVCSSDLATSGGRYYSSRFPPHLKHNRISRPPTCSTCLIALVRCLGPLGFNQVQFRERVLCNGALFPFSGGSLLQFIRCGHDGEAPAHACPADECYDTQHVMPPPAQEKPWRNQSAGRAIRWECAARTEERREGKEWVS